LLVVVLADRQTDNLVVVVTSLPTGVHSVVVVILARRILVATFKELFTMHKHKHKHKCKTLPSSVQQGH